MLHIFYDSGKTCEKGLFITEKNIRVIKKKKKINLEQVRTNSIKNSESKGKETDNGINVHVKGKTDAIVLNFSTEPFNTRSQWSNT